MYAPEEKPPGLSDLWEAVVCCFLVWFFLQIFLKGFI